MSDGRIVIDTKVDSSGAEKGINKLSGIASKGLKGFTTTVGKTSGVITAIMGSVGVIYNSQMEQYMAGFTTMLGSADKATKHINELKEFAAKTPFEMSDLAQASTTLQAFGVDVKEVTPDLKMLGDISLGNKEKFNGLALVFGQVKSQGKLMGQDLMQMINNGFNPLQVISEKTGKSMSQLKDEMSKGKITYEMVADAMKIATSEGGMFAGAMDKQSQTMSGLLSTLKDNLGALAGKLAEPIFKLAKKGMEDFLPVLDNVSAAVDKMFQKIEEGKSVGQSMYEAFQGLIPENILFSITSVIDGIIFAIKGLVAFIKGDTEKARDMFYTMFPTDDIGNEKYVDMIMGVLDVIKKLFNFVIDNKDSIIAAFVGIGVAMEVFKAVELVQKFIKAYKAWKIATEGMTVAQWLLNTAMAANPVGIIIAAIAGLVAGIVVLWNANEGFRDAVINIFTQIGEFFKNLWNTIVIFFTETIPNAFMQFITFMSELPGKIWSVITQIFNFFVQLGIDLVNWVVTAIPQFISSFISFICSLPGKIGYVIGAILGTFARFAVDLITWAVTNIPKFVVSVVTFIAQLPGRIWTWLCNVISKVVTWGVEMVSKGITAAINFVSNVIKFVASLPSKIWEWLKQAAGKVLSWGANLASAGARAAGELVKSAVDGIKSLPEKFLEIGVNLVKGLWNGIKSVKDWIWGKIKDFCGGIVDGFKDFFGIHSPSRLMRDMIGKNLVRGIGIGFDIETPNLQKDIDSNLSSLTAKMQATVDYETSKTSRAMTSGNKTINNSNTVTNNDNGVTQNIHINQPVKSPAETARALKKVGRDLVLGC
ncbi:tape measure protein [Clostridium sp. KNHs214]|uniref:tape measure protein n=1 Tax=Clostridium sp. KNHs214 TaxID=1540257 RepID=UPI000558F23B|nr:tape measure protein [Clostridium sp. KNHs214]